MKQATFPTLETDVYALHQQIELLMGGRTARHYLWAAEPIGNRMMAVTIRSDELPAALKRFARAVPVTFETGRSHPFGLVAQCAIRRGPTNARTAIDVDDDARRILWLERRAAMNGFDLVSVEIASVERIRVGKIANRHIADRTRFEGTLRIADPDRFAGAMRNGIGHGKAFGLGFIDVE